MSNKLKNIYTNAFDNIIKSIQETRQTLYLSWQESLRIYMWRISTIT